jgi:uncharacterized protein YbjT (DUF2867 family)
VPGDLIAVTGATGGLGRRVVRMLAERGARQRLVVRDAARAPQADGAEVAVAALEDGRALRDALSGARTLLLVSVPESPDRVAVHRGAVRAAAEAGVQRVVYTSFIGPAPQATFPYARDHTHTEMAIREAGLALTALRNTIYADVVPWLADDAGVIRAPAADGRVAWVAREDIARLAAETLLDDGHAHAAYDVTGPEAIDLHETARLLGAATGRPGRYEPQTPAEARRSHAGAEEWRIDGMVGLFEAIATGEVGATSHTIEHVTGRRPWSLAEYLRAEPPRLAATAADPAPA